jgi:hypothetical protein
MGFAYFEWTLRFDRPLNFTIFMGFDHLFVDFALMQSATGQDANARKNEMLLPWRRAYHAR